MSTTGIAIGPAKPRLGSAFAGAVVGAVIVIGLAIAGAAGSTDEVVMVAVVTGAWAVAAVFVAVQRPNEPLWVWTLAVALAGRDRGHCPRSRAARAVRRVRVRGRACPKAGCRGASVARRGGRGRRDRFRSRCHERRQPHERGDRRVDRARARGGVRVRARVPAGGRGEPQPVAVGGLGCRRGRRPRTGHRPARGAVGLAEHRGRARDRRHAVRAVRDRGRRRSRRSPCASIACSYARSRRAASSSWSARCTSSSCSASVTSPDQSERRVLGLSIVAAVIAALLYGPVKSRLSDAANRRVYGERQAPDEPLQTFGARMSRAIPLDELLLQLAESLEEEHAAHRGRGVDRHRRCARARRCPCRIREPPRIRLDDDEVTVIARAHVSGQRVAAGVAADVARRARRPDGAGRAARALRRAARARSSCARRAGDAPFTEERGSGAHRARPPGRARAPQRRGSTPRCRRRSTSCASRNDELRGLAARIVAAADAVPPSDRAQPARRRAAAPRRAGGEARSRAPDRSKPTRRRWRPMLEELRGDVQEDADRAARARARHLPAAAHGPRPRRSAARRREPRRARHRRATPMSAATRPTSRRRSTSAASKRCRTRASTQARARAITITVEEYDGRAVLRGGRQRRRVRPDERRRARPRLRQHGRPASARSAVRSRSTARRDPAPRYAGRIPLEPVAATVGRRSGLKRRGDQLRELSHSSRTTAGPKSSLWTYAIAPQSRASAGRSASEYVERRITCVSGCAARMRRVASMPLMPGRLMSMSTRSGACTSTWATASSPVSASPATAKPPVTPDHGARDRAERQLVVDDQYRDRPRRAVGGTHLAIHARTASGSDPGWSPAVRCGASPPAPRGTGGRLSPDGGRRLPR